MTLAIIILCVLMAYGWMAYEIANAAVLEDEE